MENLTDDQKLELLNYIEEVVRDEINKIVNSKAENINKQLEQRVNIDLLVTKIFAKSKVRGYTDSINATLEGFLNDLADIEKTKDKIFEDIKKSLEEDKKELVEKTKNDLKQIIDTKKEEITSLAMQAYELSDYIENSKGRIVEDIVSSATKQIKLEDTRPRRIEIYENGMLSKSLDEGLYHEKFETIYKLVKIGLPTMLIGPTGSGKSLCVGQVAKLLGMQMYYTNNASEEYKLLGFTDAHGKYKETQFYKAFKNGGLFFLDEIDNSHPSALLSLNSAIASTKNGNVYMAFEDGEFTQAHPDFRIVAAANTWGNGATRMYCGRSELDAASLDRFIPVYFDYDKKIEKSLINDDELLHFFWNFRRIVDECGIRHTTTTRNIDYACKLKEAGFSIEEILNYTIIKELDFEDLKIIYNRFIEEAIEPSIYSDELKKMVLRKA